MIIDIDSHFYEPLDWLEDAAPEIAAALPATDPITLVIGTAFGEVLSTLPPEVRPDPVSLIPKSLRPGSGPLTVEEIERYTPLLLGWLRSVQGAHEPTDRVDYLDAQGIDQQWVLPTFAFNPISTVRRTMPERMPAIVHAYNRWAADHLAGFEDRLLPVPLVDPKTMDRGQIEAELRASRDRGARTFVFWATPVDGVSLSHPDWAWFWDEAAALGMFPMLHVGAGRPLVDTGWLNNGRSFPSSLVSYFTQLQQLPEMLLTELIASGTFERLPNLRILVCELGVDWLPMWRRRADHFVTLAGKAYDLPEKPSHYIDTNVRVSPLHTDPTADVIAEIGARSIVFSTDYPHNEGGDDAAATFRGQLEGKVGDAELDAFFGGTIEADLALTS